jgi:RimJ/RimL family protein N-acetyltransferase
VSAGWTVRLADDAAARAFLERDPAWNGYALADLEPPHRQYARFCLAARAGQDRAALLRYTPPEFTVVELTGDPGGVAALLAAGGLPRRTQLIARLEHRPAITAHYRSDRWDPMWRMALAPGGLRLPAGVERARRLGPADLPALRGLYAARDYFAPFSDAMLDGGVYYGLWHDGRLVAAAGTHVVARIGQVAAVGNVYTLPEARGRGYAQATAAAVVRDLLAQGCRRVILNVHAGNQAAIAAYHRLGFEKVCDFWEIVDAVARPEAG